MAKDKRSTARLVRIAEKVLHGDDSWTLKDVKSLAASVLAQARGAGGGK